MLLGGWACVTVSRLGVSLLGVSRLVGDLFLLSCSSVNARQSSVRLRHTLSALRRACLSDELYPFATETLPDGAVLTPNMVERLKASVIVASRAAYTSELRTLFAFASADCKRGWT